MYYTLVKNMFKASELISQNELIGLPLTCFLLWFCARGQTIGAFSTLPGLSHLVFLFIGAFA